MAELIQREDSLNTGREKINEAIKASDRAEGKSDYAVDIAETALSNSENTQTQLDTIVIDGDSSVEAAQARVDSEGNTYNTLKERLDEKETEFTSQLAQKANQNTLNEIKTNVKLLGINTDGSDVTTDLQNVLSEFTGELYFPKGQYTITQPIIITNSNVKLDFHPESEFIYDGEELTTSAFIFRGQQDIISTLSQNAIIDDNKLTLLNINGVNIGDWIYIESEEKTSENSRADDTKREVHKVIGFNSSLNELTVENPLIFSYDSSKNVRVYKMSFLHNVSVNGLTLKVFGQNLLKGVEFDKCFNPKITNSNFYDIGQIAIEFRYSIFGQIIGNYADINFSDGFQYGVVTHSCSHVSIVANTIH